jgi:hypothetical protein
LRRVAIALVHYPVLDRAGETVTTAITNLDLHDMARSARTYGVDRLFVVHPVEAQRALADRIREHWVSGSGKKRIPDRATALDVLAIVPSMADVFEAMAPSVGRRGVMLWTTAASARGGPVTRFDIARQTLELDGPPVLIAFGTGWGLARELVDDADARLEPIYARADTGFNHLSVRAACAIALDRLLGR